MATLVWSERSIHAVSIMESYGTRSLRKNYCGTSETSPACLVHLVYLVGLVYLVRFVS
jgi:hypothetical protein